MPLFQKFALKTLAQRPTFIWSCKRFFAPNVFCRFDRSHHVVSGFWRWVRCDCFWSTWFGVCWSWLYPSGSLLGPVQRGPMNLSHDPWHCCFGACRKSAAHGSDSEVFDAPMFLSDVMLDIGLLPKDLAQLLWREL